VVNLHFTPTHLAWWLRYSVSKIQTRIFPLKMHWSKFLYFRAKQEVVALFGYIVALRCAVWAISCHEWCTERRYCGVRIFPYMGENGTKWERGHRILHQQTRSNFSGPQPLRRISSKSNKKIKNCDCRSVDRQTDRQKDANCFIIICLVLCYSNGTDKWQSCSLRQLVVRRVI